MRQCLLSRATGGRGIGRDSGRGPEPLGAPSMINFSIAITVFFPTPGSSGLATAQVGFQSSMDSLIIT